MYHGGVHPLVRGAAIPDAPLLAPLGFGLAAGAATLAGGLLAIRLKGRVGLLLGVTAGIVLGVALFDLVPEALAMAGPGVEPRAILAWVGVGWAAYLLFERLLGGVRRAGDWRAHLAPATLTLHSFTDGLGIGLSFQVSPAIGGLVAVAVLTHDVADGINVVSLCLAAGRERAARAWLAANGAAPLLGVAIGLIVRLPPPLLAPVLAGFGGVFLYIASCELVPRSLALDPRLRTGLAILAGMGVMLGVTAAH